jgi:hypothetical protein
MKCGRPDCRHDRNGFSGGFRGRLGSHQGPSGNRPFSARRCGSPLSRSSSHPFCAGTIDLAPVSKTVRSVSNNVRRRHPIVSPNLRRKVPLIARRDVHHCAPLHIRDLQSAGVVAEAAKNSADALNAMPSKSPAA